MKEPISKTMSVPIQLGVLIAALVAMFGAGVWMNVINTNVSQIPLIKDQLQSLNEAVRENSRALEANIIGIERDLLNRISELSRRIDRLEYKAEGLDRLLPLEGTKND